MNRTTSPMTPEQLDRLARRRAGAKLGWYLHALVFITANAGLAAGLTGQNWAIFPALGWGLGLGIHGAVVFLAMAGGGWRERLVQQERERLLARRDPW